MSSLASRRRRNSCRRQLKVLRIYDRFLSQYSPQITRGEAGLPGNDSIVFDLLNKRKLGYWLRGINYD